MRRLASADAFGSMGLDRQAALWQVRALKEGDAPLFDSLAEDGGSSLSSPSSLRRVLPGVAPSLASSSLLPPIPAPVKTAFDYAATGLSLKPHPLSFLRERLAAAGVVTASVLKDQARAPNGRRLAVAGIVLVRQRPGTAAGIVFAPIEDETGVANLIIRPQIYTRYRQAARHAVIILARGKVERQGKVVHVLVSKLEAVGPALADLAVTSRDFH